MADPSGAFPLKFDRPFYNREELAVAVGVSLETVKRRLRDEELVYDGEIVGKRCFTRVAALAFAERERAKGETRGRKAQAS